MSESPPYLLSIAIGPVQDFIAASRKARDLWAGSELLSVLARETAIFLQDNGAELIFPARASVRDKHAVANKLLVIASAPQPLAAKAREHLGSLLNAKWEQTKDRLDRKYGLDVGNDLETDIVAAQLNQFIEWYAAWTPWTEATHVPARKQVELLLAGRKALRDFWPASGMDLQPKSSLDPSRESVIDQSRLDRDVRRRFRLKGAEQLDAISLLKRLDESNRFVSTSRVAIDPLIRDLQRNDPDGLARLKRHAAALKSSELVEMFDTSTGAGKDLEHYAPFPFDSQLVFASSKRHAKAMIEDDSQRDPATLDAWREEAAAFLDTLFATRSARTIGEMPAYYAVLRADGDRMGATLNELGSKDLHQQFSRRLGEFADRARATVARHFGGPIYSGGDDVLAFLPLDTAIPCANALREDFATTMDSALPAAIPRPTLSAGLAIGHYAEHLQSMLDRSMRAERAAKVPRNALAVDFGAHSGGGDARLVVHQWPNDALRRWADAVEMHRSGAFPDRGAYELDMLRREVRDAWEGGTFGIGAERDEDLCDDLLTKEVRRTLSRKRDRHGQIVRQDIIDRMIGRLGQSAEGSPLDNLGTLVNELVIARRIARVLPDGLPGKPNPELALWREQGGSQLLADAAGTARPIAGHEETGSAA